MAEETLSKLRAAVRDVPDFPKTGIIFKDITPILKDGALFRVSVDIFLHQLRNKRIDKIVGIDARGFLFGSAVAYELGIGFARHRWHQRLRCDPDQKSWWRFNRSDLSDRAGVSARAREARSNSGDIVSEILNWSSRTKSRDPTASPLSYRLVIPRRGDGEPHS